MKQSEFDKLFPGGIKPNQITPYVHKGKWAIHELLPILLEYIGTATVRIATFNISEDSLRPLILQSCLEYHSTSTIYLYRYAKAISILRYMNTINGASSQQTLSFARLLLSLLKPALLQPNPLLKNLSVTKILMNN
ncbi:hypothetical protein JGH11_04520 [Dysgonomonas sp. Marseille-P4677]|nr:hypothetical protein [Dysgonomonas sp. Marseille-P4677]